VSRRSHKQKRKELKMETIRPVPTPPAIDPHVKDLIILFSIKLDPIEVFVPWVGPIVIRP